MIILFYKYWGNNGSENVSWQINSSYFRWPSIDVSLHYVIQAIIDLFLCNIAPANFIKV